jgi:hypothetical protein
MTTSSLPVFKKVQFEVNRRSIDFLGLHDMIVIKHLPAGVIIPALPENDSKIGPKDVIGRRRAQLERYLIRLARNKTLLCDPNFLMFLELNEELPKTENNAWRYVTSTSIPKTFKDDWFDEKQVSAITLKTMKAG